MFELALVRLVSNPAHLQPLFSQVARTTTVAWLPFTNHWFSFWFIHRMSQILPNAPGAYRTGLPFRDHQRGQGYRTGDPNGRTYGRESPQIPLFPWFRKQLPTKTEGRDIVPGIPMAGPMAGNPRRYRCFHGSGNSCRRQTRPDS